MERAFAVGEERIAADADEQPTLISLDRLRDGVEADGHALDEHLAHGLGLPSRGSRRSTAATWEPKTPR